MRRIELSITVCLLLVTSLVACGGDPATDNAGEDMYITLPDGRVILNTVDQSSLPEGDVIGTEDVLVEVEDGDTFDSPDQNGFDYPCEPMTFESCVTACDSAGQRKCLKSWGPCIPPGEFCGNCADDDCDGLINEGCPPNPECNPVEPDCPVAKIDIAEGTQVWTEDVLHLSGANSSSPNGAITEWEWWVETPDGSTSSLLPSPSVVDPTFKIDAAGQYLFSLDVRDDTGVKSCHAAQVAVNASAYPPQTPEIGCSDGEREGFVDDAAYPHIAGCSGAWENPGITPESVKQTCNGQAGDDSGNKEGAGCAAPDLCAEGWHICSTSSEVAAKSPTGCAGSVPPGAKEKSLFFAMRQPSENGSVCGAWGDGFNDVFGCGNLGAGLGPDKNCGPLDRVLASTQPNSCGFNEAEPPHGPWECMGDQTSHLNEGKVVTKKACQNSSCSYDGDPIGTWDKGGVLCCRN